ncbi:putative Signal transduction histidine kinase [Desulfamplus magnetovallimortis]|uniref:histidine kinase n=1 Tax=Desulfamplus magnetovallimortis TaxID=1246637 RepID=A0A1W1HJI0_9BACT|nr:ATP-binding protein [Desulfamplus magnetovallimortis]SLM32518.1 putative Signal transduction histidine kinase [Desulfamplus magnetovallimortis]
MEENRRILVIDDDVGIRETYQSILLPEADESETISMGRALFDMPKGSESGFLPGETLKTSPDKCYEVVMAENGTIGIEEVKKSLGENRPFSVAFIDMKMPGLNGGETSGRIWEIDPFIKIVIVTAYSEYSPEDIIAVTGRDDIFYLRKPFNHEEILQFARALSNTWNLEHKKNQLQESLRNANEQLEEMNQNLKDKVQKQASMIVQAEKMASIGLLAAGVAHEINNPVAFVRSNLSAIKKYFERIVDLYEKYATLEKWLMGSGSPDAATLLHDISQHKKKNRIDIIMADLEDLANESIEGIDRIRDIVQDLRTFSRVDESEYKMLDINSAIDTTFKMVKSEIKYKAVVKKNYGDIPHILCYPQKISQIFMNLFVNAAQSIEENGTIEITTRSVKKGKRKTDHFVEIVIKDTGCGIPEVNLQKLFDPFFTTKPVGKGTGLGLSIVYEIIKAHHGTIEVESEVGKGSCFTILLPVNAENR